MFLGEIKEKMRNLEEEIDDLKRQMKDIEKKLRRTKIEELPSEPAQIVNKYNEFWKEFYEKIESPPYRYNLGSSIAKIEIRPDGILLIPSAYRIYDDEKFVFLTYKDIKEIVNFIKEKLKINDLAEIW